jgi:hypothetical protein
MALCVHSFIQFHAAVVVKHKEKFVSSLPPAACILCIVLCNVVSSWKLCSFQLFIRRDVEGKASVLIWSLFRPAVWDFMTSTDSVIKDSIIIFNYALQPLRLIVRSGLDVPTFATRRLHTWHYARAPNDGRWTVDEKCPVILPKCVIFTLPLGIFHMP